MMQAAGDKLNGVGLYRSDFLIAVIARSRRRRGDLLIATAKLMEIASLRSQ